MKSRKSILYLTYSSGGPRVWAENLAREMEKRGWKTEVKYGRINFFASHFRKCDIVHSTQPLIFSRAKKFILTIKGNYLKEEGHLLRLFPLAIKSATIVTTPSEYMKKVLDIDKAIVISNGIYLPVEFKTNYGFIEKNSTFGILTNFNFEPKAQGVLELSKILSKISPQGKLIVGGAGKYFETYKNEILKNYPQTKFLGHCRKEDLFSKIDIFSYYSFLDNQPNALMEAMAFGLPVLSNDIGAVGEIMTGDMKRYVAKDEKEYTELLHELIDSEDNRAACGRLARETIGQFSWNKIADEWEEIYNQK